MFPTRHQLLRDRLDWAGTLAGLARDADGELRLARVPAPGGGKDVEIQASYPYVRQVSGIAAGPCNAVFVADTAGNRVLYVDGLCASRTWLDAPGHFATPRALVLTEEALLVADTGHARIQSLARPQLEANLAYAPGVAPTSIAVDSQQRLLVVDAMAVSVRRLRAGGMPDTAFDSMIAAQGKLQLPLFVACDTTDRVLISDSVANEIFLFDADGQFVETLPGPAGWLPGALAAQGRRVYVADAASGSILVFEAGLLVGRVRGWHGPVTALAITDAGDLLIKPGLDEAYYRFTADGAFVDSGSLEAGPFDAGEEREWERAWADLQTPAGTTVTVSIACKATLATPLPGDWVVLPSFDALLTRQHAGSGRFAFLRVQLSSTSPSRSPVLSQVRLATASEDLRDYLPLTYSRNEGKDEFLSRWLRLLRGEFQRVEEHLDDMPRVGDPQFLPASALPWLAQWLSLELPRIAGADERRDLLARAAKLSARRGTKQSIAEFVELHTGVRPAIVEEFGGRRVWVLGESSRVGFDTQLAPLDPLGIIVPDRNAAPGCCEPSETVEVGVRGRAVVGESGPLAAHQTGMPLFAEEAYRFCVIVDAYRAHDASIRDEIARIVEREKPAHTDFRIEYIAPDMRIGLQASIGIDAIIGGDPPALNLGSAQLGAVQLPPLDVARVGGSVLDGTLTLT